MKKNTITVFIGIDHFTNFNQYLEAINQIVKQNNSGFTVEIVAVTSAQVPDELNKMYMNVEEIKQRYKEWPDWLIYTCFKSDDHSYNKFLNYTENEVNGEIGELCAFKSVSPIVWFPNHLVAHWDEYSREKKKCGWMISRLEVKDLSNIKDEKKNTVTFRLDDFPDHIDKIVLDEIFISHKVLLGCDFNAAAIMTEHEGSKVAIFHAGKFLIDSVKKFSELLKLKGYNPKEITVQHWINMKEIEKGQQAQQNQELLATSLEDGAIMFAEVEDDGAITFSEEN